MKIARMCDANNCRESFLRPNAFMYNPLAALLQTPDTQKARPSENEVTWSATREIFQLLKK